MAHALEGLIVGRDGPSRRHRLGNLPSDESAVNATRDKARTEELDLAPRRADPTSPAELAALVDGVVQEFGRIDILVNAAAVAAFAWIEEKDYERHWASFSPWRARHRLSDVQGGLASFECQLRRSHY